MVTPATQPQSLPSRRRGANLCCTPRLCTATRLTATPGGPVVAELEQLTGVETRRIHVDRGYRGHNHPHKFRVWITGQARRVTRPIRREMKRRAAVEPVIGHLKPAHRLGRNCLKGRNGDRANAVLAAAGDNFALLLAG